MKQKIYTQWLNVYRKLHRTKTQESSYYEYLFIHVLIVNKNIKNCMFWWVLHETEGNPGPQGWENWSVCPREAVQGGWWRNFSVRRHLGTLLRCMSRVQWEIAGEFCPIEKDSSGFEPHIEAGWSIPISCLLVKLFVYSPVEMTLLSKPLGCYNINFVVTIIWSCPLHLSMTMNGQ